MAMASGRKLLLTQQKEYTAMKAMTWAVALALGCAAFGGGKDPKTSAGPAYDRGSESKFLGKIAEVREVPKGELPGGIYLTVKTEKGDSVNVYVGPREFVKIFDVTFKAGEEVEVLASKVKFEGGDIFLAREIRMGQVTLILRDDTGAPNWEWGKAFPTGL